MSRLLHQIQNRGQMSVPKSVTGQLLFTESEIADKLVSFRSKVMTLTAAKSAQRSAYPTDIPPRWCGAGKILWQAPTLDMVFHALQELDPSSAPGPDGFSGAFNKQFKHEFAPLLLDILRQTEHTRPLPRRYDVLHSETLGTAGSG